MNKEVIDLLKQKIIYMFIPVIIILGCGYMIFGVEDAKAPQLIDKYRQIKELKTSIANQQSTLDSIIADNQKKKEAVEDATQKSFYSFSENNGIDGDFSVMLGDITSLIKQNGIRMKSIKNTPDPDDNLLKNGGSTYSGNRVDFELVGYYAQFASLLNELNNYGYFISINKFEIKPYQYDKRILICDLSIVLYAKK